MEGEVDPFKNFVRDGMRPTKQGGLATPQGPPSRNTGGSMNPGMDPGTMNLLMPLLQLLIGKGPAQLGPRGQMGGAQGGGDPMQALRALIPSQNPPSAPGMGTLPPPQQTNPMQLIQQLLGGSGGMTPPVPNPMPFMRA